jgi:hypothetical protein
VLFCCGICFDGRANNSKSTEWNGNNETVISHTPSKSTLLKNRLFLLYCFSFALSNMVFYVPIIYMVSTVTRFVITKRWRPCFFH